MEYFSLTTPQKNIWNLQKYYGDTSVSNLCGAIIYNEKKNNTLLQQAIRKFIEIQSGLRLHFMEDGEPKQYVSDVNDMGIPVMIFSSEEELDCYANKFASNPLGLTKGDMFRFVVFQLEDKSGVLVVLSHLVSDAWTFGLMAKQVDNIYNQLENGRTPMPGKFDYIEFIHSYENYLASDKYIRDKEYWEEKYSEQPEKSNIKISSGSALSIESKRITKTIPNVLENKINQYCEYCNVTPAVVFETAIVTYLAQINRENKSVTIGMPVLNRGNQKEKQIAGMFVSTMPLTVVLNDDMTVKHLAETITKEHMDIFRHQKYPYDHILKYLREKKNFSGNMYDVMVSYQNAKTETNAETKWYSNGYSEIPLAIHIDNRDGHSTHTISIDYQTELFCEDEVGYLIERFEYIIEQITENDGVKVKDICIVPQQELDKVINKFNDTYIDYPREKCIHELFMEQARKTPDRTALVFEDKSFTYRQLDEMSNSLAHFLREKGVNKNDKVAVLLNRDEKVVLSQLAVLRLGAVFIPVDTRYPKERIEYILNQSNAKIIIKNNTNHMHFEMEAVIEDCLFECGNEFICPEIDPGDICYIIFTSGSTGEPKGCTLTNRGLVNFCINNNILPECNKLQYQICVSVNTISFDFFIAESLLPLVNGYTMVLASEEESMNQKLFSDMVVRNNVNIIQTTPTRHKLYFGDKTDLEYTKNFKVIVSAGEELPLDLLKFFHEYTDAVVFNPLGPSECSVWVVGGKIHMDTGEISEKNITIGKPIANTQIYILDRNQKPVPVGVAGELCIAGEGVGKGYLNRPELTAERFVNNPFATVGNHHGKIMYHTGDLARWRADGDIEYLGRIDTQVKIRGLRIELGEIESVMGSMEGIGLTAVTDKRDENNRQYLVGYYTSDTEIDEKLLRNHLAAKLPGYMIPNYFMHLQNMPMTPSGKTDRKNLPQPDFNILSYEYVPPVTDTEKKLAHIWEKLLNMERVGKTDNFYDLGGDSLTAISMLNEIEEEFQVAITVKDIMVNSELCQLAKCIETACEINHIKAYHKDRYVLLPQQKAIYAVCSKTPDTLAYNMPCKISLPENIDMDRLKESICEVVENHRLLKSYIKLEKDEIYGIYDGDAHITFEKYSNGNESSFVRPFALDKAPLVRVGFTEDSMLFDIHHIITDGDSLNIILREISDRYAGKQLNIHKVEYSDYARYFYSLNMEEHKSYFKEMLKCDFVPVMLPQAKKKGIGGNSKLYTISKDIFEQAKEFARNNGLTDTMVFLGAYGILLSKYTANMDVLSSIVLQNRVHIDTKDMVGMFVNTLPVHIAVKDNTKEYMQDIKQLLLNLFRYQEIPFWEIANAVGMNDKTVVNTSFVYQGDGEKILTVGEEKLVPCFMNTNTAKFDFFMELTPSDYDCKMRMEYNCEKYDGEFMDKLAESYIHILEQLNEEKIEDISVLSKQEYQMVINGFNDTYVDYPREKCIHELFVEQAGKTPDRTALVFEDKSFTYRQLDEMSNSLAHFLREKGVKPNDIVPIIAKRSWHVIVAMLGILKAGGAYMPISPEYPEDRIESIIEIAKSKISLLYLYAGNIGIKSCNLNEFNYSKCVNKIDSKNNSKDYAYIIFTSGSTGKPKGIAITHGNVVNYADNNKNNICSNVINNKNKSIVSVTNFIFDIFVTESLLPLLNGLCVYFANDEEVASQIRLSKLINNGRIDIMQTTPTKMRSYIIDKKNLEYLKSIKVIVLGGEMLPVDLLQELRKYTNAKIYNIYGPAETTVWSTNTEIVNDDITIGKPIANTQTYILDRNQKPVPVGVAGELCIAGEGVGKGYLNRPELTAERFVNNPFATVGNHHGKIMYHTGDLARWRSDGDIEYLGRIDTQVKIRGLRIELGEIESVMGSMEGIGLTAVTDKRDENNRQYLVGYYTSDTEIDEKLLRNHLAAKLPGYMIPNYFMHLQNMPMTPSGKTDRKNLPQPDFNILSYEYVPPVTDTEKKLCHLLEELMHLERFGLHDNFFDMGGDSLTAIEFVAKAHGMGIEFSLQNVFDYPTVKQLCDLLVEGKSSRVSYISSDFEKYQCLLARNAIDDEYAPEKKSLGNVLLTGATGFLGAHVLDCFMREEKGKIYCLVRSSKENDRRGKIHEILKYYFGDKYESEFGKRIIPVIGDIEQEQLSEYMPTDVDTVIHTAASVKHYGAYDYFHKVNVAGTCHVIDYAKSVNAKLIHISTLSVSGNSMADDFSAYR